MQRYHGSPPPGGFAVGQAEYVRVPFADVAPLKVLAGVTDEQVLFLSDIFPTGDMGAAMCGISRGDGIAVWGCGPVGQFAIASAELLGAEHIIATNRFPERLAMAQGKAGATDTINYEETAVYDALMDLTGGTGPDACIPRVRRHFPMGSFMNRSLTMKSGQCHVQRYMKPLLERIQNGEIDPSFVITHTLKLDEAPQGSSTFLNKEDDGIKIVLKN